MAVLVTVNRADLYPPSTAVKIFALTAQHSPEFLASEKGNPENWKPAPAKLTELTTGASSGKLDIPNMAVGTAYLIWAEVGGKDVYLTVRPPRVGGVTSPAKTSPRKVAVKTTSTELVPANAAREGLEIENQGATNVIYLGLEKAAVLKDDIGPIAVNGKWNGLVGGKLWTGAVFAIAETAEVTATVMEV